MERIASACKRVTAIVGSPVLTERGAVSAAAVLRDGRIDEIVEKQYLTARREMGFIVEGEGYKTINICGCNMAIMVGTRTVLLDNPRLLTTHWSGRNPIRITLDRHHILPQESRIFSDESPTIVYSENTDWHYICADLAKQNIHSVLVEGGTTLLQHILDSGIYDEVHIEVSDIPLARTAYEMPNGVKAPAYSCKTQPKVVNNHQIYIENLHK